MQCCLEELKGGRGQPFAKKTSLGCTRVGEVDKIDSSNENCAIFTLFARDESAQLQDLNANLQWFWELETVGKVDDTPTFTDYYERVIEKRTYSTRYEN